MKIEKMTNTRTMKPAGLIVLFHVIGLGCQNILILLHKKRSAGMRTAAETGTEERWQR